MSIIIAAAMQQRYNEPLYNEVHGVMNSISLP